MAEIIEFIEIIEIIEINLNKAEGGGRGSIWLLHYISKRSNLISVELYTVVKRLENFQ